MQDLGSNSLERTKLLPASMYPENQRTAAGPLRFTPGSPKGPNPTAALALVDCRGAKSGFWGRCQSLGKI